MTTARRNDLDLERLCALPVHAADAARSERVRARCHKALARRGWLGSLIRGQAAKISDSLRGGDGTAVPLARGQARS